MASPKLPPFSGRCHVSGLEHAASQSAHKAYALRLMQPAPAAPATLPATLPAGITARTGDAALWLLILLLAVLAGCKVASTTRERETAVPTKSFITRVPAGPYDWSDAE